MLNIITELNFLKEIKKEEVLDVYLQHVLSNYIWLKS